MVNAMAKNNPRYIRLALFAISLAVIVGLAEISRPVQEAYAFQPVTVTTTTAVAKIQEAYSLQDNRWVYVDLEGITTVRVLDANSSTTIRTFNMSNALMNGFNIQYKITNMDCNAIPVLSICAVGYTTQGTGSCSGSANACMERVVMFNFATGAFTSLSGGYNYTHGNDFINTVNFNYGQQQFNIYVNHRPTGGGTSKIDTLVFNSTDTVSSHPLIFGNTFDTTGNANYVLTRLGSFIVGGVQVNYMGTTQAGLGSFVTFNRGANSFGCSVNLGGTGIKDFIYVNDNAGINWWMVGAGGSTLITKVNGSCVNVGSVDITAATGGNALNSISINSIRHEIYVASNSKLFVINETSLSTTPIMIIPITSNPPSDSGIASYSQNTATANVITATGTTQLQVFYWNFQGASSAGSGSSSSNSGTVCIDITGTGNNLNNSVCYPCNPATGICYSTGGAMQTLRSGENVTHASAIWGCGIGYSSCTNLNTQTNGVGYTVLGLIVFFTVVGLMYFSHKTGHEFTEVTVPAIFLMLIEAGATWQLSFTDAIPFTIGMVVISAFGSVKIVSYFTR